MKIRLPDSSGALQDYVLTGTSLPPARLAPDSVRILYAAAHVVADPLSNNTPFGGGRVDWPGTMKYRHYLAGMGIGIAEAMDTAQRGAGLNRTDALELIRRTREELPDALVANGCGTDHLDPSDAGTPDDVRRAYLEQAGAIQDMGGRIILMASRALARVAKGPDDYISVYNDVLSSCDKPVILHWLGEMFDPMLAGYWGTDDFDTAMETVLAIIDANISRVQGIKISLLDAEKEIRLRRRLPRGIRMYTGDDFNYPELIEGDERGFSHALLGIFDPLAPAAAHAVNRLSEGDTVSFRAMLDPTVPLARHIFRAPTQHYKTGVVFLAWLNGFQEHFIMLNGAQAARSLPYFTDCFKLADQCGLLRDPDIAVENMGRLLKFYGA